MRKFNAGIIFMLLFIMLIGVGAVFADGQQEPKGTMSGTLELWHPYTQKTRLEAMELNAKEFMQVYPEIKVEIEIVPFPKIPEKMTSALAADIMPDIFGMPIFNATTVYQAGKLRGVDKLIEEMGGMDIYLGAETIRRALEYNGEIIQIPLYGVARPFVYRRDLFEAAGLSSPETWDEYLSVTEKLTNPPDQYGMIMMWNEGDIGATYYHNTFMVSAGGTFFDKEGNIDITTQEHIDTAEMITKLYQVGSPKGEFSFTYRDIFNLYTSGKSALVFNSGFMINAFESNAPELAEKNALGFAKPPFKVKSGNQASVAAISLIKGDMEAASDEFIKFIYDPDRYMRWVHTVPGGTMPWLRATAESPEYWEQPLIKKYEKDVRTELEMLENGAEFGTWNGLNLKVSVLTDFGIIEKMYQRIALGQVTPKEGLMQAQEEINQKVKELFRE
jgi:multiple sugar transport system substrate-binding protein